MRRAFAGLALAVVLALSFALDASAQGCTRDDFEAVVGQAAAALRELNARNKPGFQAKLRQLRTKRGWTHDQFLAEAAPLVQDAKIAEFDQKSSAFLAHIEKLGSEGARAEVPDCSRLAEVRQSMQGLVEVQQEKWRYMFDKIEAELKK